METIGNAIFAVILVGFCVAVIYAIFQIGRYFAKKADKQ